MAIILLYFLGKKLHPILLKYATTETKRFSIIVINQAVDEKIVKKIDRNIFKIEKNNSGEIEAIDFDNQKVNNLLKIINNEVEKKLQDLEKGNIKDINVVDTFRGVRYRKVKEGIVCEFPAGIAFSNPLLVNIGPKIPVRLSFIGEVTTTLKSKVKSYGINNAYLELGAHIEVMQKITMPISTKEVKVEVDVPLTIKVIEGKVPTYYQNSNTKSSNFSLPKTK